MTKATDAQRAAASSSSVGEPPRQATNRVQFTRAVASLSYAEQIAALKPGGMAQLPTPTAMHRGQPAQMAAEPVQMEGAGTPPGGAPAPGGAPTPARGWDGSTSIWPGCPPPMRCPLRSPTGSTIPTPW